MKIIVNYSHEQHLETISSPTIRKKQYRISREHSDKNAVIFNYWHTDFSNTCAMYNEPPA